MPFQRKQDPTYLPSGKRNMKATQAEWDEYEAWLLSGGDHVYCTSFCNFGHLIRTGEPVGHECYVLPVAMLKAEQEDEYDKALDIMCTWTKRHLHRGLKDPEASTR